MILHKFLKAKKICPPDWLIDNIHYLTEAGSLAYGTANEFSDIDLFGFATPKKSMVFPHLYGFIPNFGTKPENFERWSEQHIFDDDKREYDFCILGIVHFFHLCFINNPDQLDVLFTPRECVRHITTTGQLVRDNRHKFLSKRAYYKYRGYAMSQMEKAIKEKPVGKRLAIKGKYGFDTVFASNLVRLVSECEQILTKCDIDLRLNNDHVKAVKSGAIAFEDVKKWFIEKDVQLTKLYGESKLPESPNEIEIKQLLLSCLENHYGSISKAVELPGKELEMLRHIKQIVAEID